MTKRKKRDWVNIWSIVISGIWFNIVYFSSLTESIWKTILGVVVATTVCYVIAVVADHFIKEKQNG